MHKNCNPESRVWIHFQKENNEKGQWFNCICIVKLGISAEKLLAFALQQNEMQRNYQWMHRRNF